MNKKSIIAIVILIILFSCIPYYMLHKDESYVPKETVFTVKKVKINSEEISTPYVVDAVEMLDYQIEMVEHKEYDSTCYPVSGGFMFYLEGLSNLKEYKLIEKQFYDFCVKPINYKIDGVDSIIMSCQKSYNKPHTLLVYTVYYKNDQYVLYQEMEKRRFIDMTLPMGKIKDEEDCKKFLKNYISYLGLDCFNDWKYMKNGYSSALGSAKVFIEQKDGKIHFWLEHYYG